MEASDQHIHRIEKYEKPHYLVPSTELEFDILNDFTIVSAKYRVCPINKDKLVNLVLNGDKMVELLDIKCNDNTFYNYNFESRENERDLIISQHFVKQILGENDYFTLLVKCKIYPDKNTELQGLYKSSGIISTQCEPTGFRRIVYSFDRPDILSKYIVKIRTDKIYPVVLSNGNVIESIDIDDNKHLTIWEDPHPKPSYLFALVVGDLGYIESDYYILNQCNNSDKKVIIRIYAAHNKLDQLDLAMRSIKMAMVWDEQKFGLCYDLNIFNIVCLDDFNMGAMENKSLNIFNSKYILATPKTATDMEQELVAGVIAHEYFHNWTGDRVTLEKWFDLTLKEGLTVFRDQSFTKDTSFSRFGKLLNDVVSIKTKQFLEDSGANAHPIRPLSYKVMDNFYTTTVYEKGAEIIRIYETLLGKDGFRKGMDLYFKRHDGKAVSCEDFMKAMLDANDTNNNVELKHLMQRLFNWYHQAGTPKVSIKYNYDSQNKTLNFNVVQKNEKCLEINKKYDPVLIPIRMGLLDKSGKIICPNNMKFEDDIGSFVLFLCELEQNFVLTGVESEPIPSLMRDFSAPVIAEYDMTDENRLFLMNCDPNLFNKWEQSQIISKNVINALYHDNADTKSVNEYITVLTNILRNDNLDTILKSNILTLPSLDDMMGIINDCDPMKLYKITSNLYYMIAQQNLDYLEEKSRHLMNQLKSNITCSEQIALRELLGVIMSLRLKFYNEDSLKYVDIIVNYFNSSDNLTDKINCINALARASDPTEQIFTVLLNLLTNMAQQYNGDSLMISKILRQFTKIHSPKTVKILQQIYSGEHAISHMFVKTTPNHLSALIYAFHTNPYFHQISVSENNTLLQTSNVASNTGRALGYEFVTNCILDIDKYNASYGSLIASVFEIIEKLSPEYKKLMRQSVNHILNCKELSENTKEILSKI